MRRIAGPRERSKIGNLWRFNRFIDNRCLAPLTLDGDGDGDGDGTVHTLRRRPYRLLPRQELIDLFVLKLDGSVFGVRISRNGTVADLKQAIEEVFDSPRGVNIARLHGEKLIDDKACIRVFGIKDGDQLQFIRHMSINCLPMKRDRKNQAVSCKTVLFLSAESKSVEENQLAGQDDPENVHEDGSNQEEVPRAGFQLANYFRGRLLYSRIWDFFKSASEGRNRSSSGFFFTRHY